MNRVIITILLCAVCTIGYAQDSNSLLLKKLVDKNVLTQEEANELKTDSTSTELKKDFTPLSDKVRMAFNTPYMQFGGYGLILHRYSNINEVKHSTTPRVLFMWMKGELTPQLKYFVMMEFINPALFEYYIEWSKTKDFTLKFGQMKTPLSIENQLSLTELESVMNTRTVSYLIGMDDDIMKLQNGRNNTGRDIGIMSYGSIGDMGTHRLLHYNVGVFQGAGINTAENNNVKDLATNVLLEPVKGLRVGGGVYYGQALYKQGADTIVNNHVHNRWIASAEYKSDRFYARAEWINGNDGGVKKGGIYGTALYYFMPKKLNGFVKVDYFDKDKSQKQCVTDYMLGANYYFYRQCRFQLNYTYSDYNKNWISKNSNTVMAQLQIVF